MKQVYIVIISILTFSSCEKEKKVAPNALSGLYIINEGNFNFGNAEVSYYNPQKSEVTNGLFFARNGFQLGDVAQSMYVQDSTGFIVVNNSSKIEVVRMPSLQWLRTITLPNSSPRYFLPINDSLAYVSELYAKKIWVVNYLNGTVTGSIVTTGWTEKMYKSGNWVFVQQKKNALLPGSYGTILKINTSNHTLQNANLFNGRDVLDLVIDKAGDLWVGVNEDTASQVKAAIYCYDTNLQLKKQFDFAAYGQKASIMSYNTQTDELYYVNQQVYKLPSSATQLPSAHVISTAGKNIYAMYVHSASGDIYLSDALDFVQPAQISRYHANGDFIHSFTAGVISGNFIFYEP
ncbi:MAG: hypothetical protein JNK66_13235 [Chitinophagales bacterium]|nr:hypothetical protein [Chitinophagales bacterium]